MFISCLPNISNQPPVAQYDNGTTVLAQLIHKGLIEALLLLSLGAKNNPSTYIGGGYQMIPSGYD
jgi:hypothetical protein